jgi:WD40 repeat protein
VSAPDTKRLCEQCGLELPADGGCPHCLLRLALEDDGADGPEAASALRPPTGLQSRFFGDYEILELIARGGMGVVYRARHLHLKRVVALKMIQSSQWVSPEARMRFAMEVAAAAQLNHPHIVSLYESGEFKGAHFFTMRLVEGDNLARHIKAARPDGGAAPVCQAPPLASPAAVVTLLVKIARAVHHAHQRGILHRDLKPSNILIDPQGEPHVTDFGLAKTLGADGAATFTDSVLGSPNYMAPEQAGGRRGELTTATDVWGLGAVFYEALTGTPPFHGATPIETIRKVAEEEPIPPRKLKPGLDADLETICLKCLQKNPAARYRTAEELADDLERWQKGLAIRARPVGPLGAAWRWSRRHPGFAGLGAALVVTLMAIAVGASLAAWRIRQAEQLAETRLRQALLDQVRVAHLSQEMGHREEALGLLRQAVAPAAGLALLSKPEFRAQARDELLTALVRTDLKFIPWTNWRGSPDPMLALISPDAKQVATVFDATNVVLAATQDGREQLRFTPGTTAISRLDRFSPDGRFLSLRRSDDVEVWDLQTIQRVFVTNRMSCAVTLLARPGLLLLGEDLPHVSLRDLPGLRETASYFAELEWFLQGRRAWTRLAASPDDRFLAVTRSSETVVTVLDLRTNRAVCRLTNTAPVNACAWHSDSVWLACALSDGKLAVWNTRSASRSMNLGGTTAPALAVAWHPGGRMLAVAFEGRSLRLADLDANRWAFEAPGDARLASFAAEGRRFGPVFRGNEPGWLEITEPAEFKQFTVGSTEREFLICRFTPDSRLVVALGAADGVSFVDFIDPITRRKPPGLSRRSAHAFAIDPRGELLLAATKSSLLRWTPDERESNRFAMTTLRQLPTKDWADIEFTADGAQLIAAHPRRGVAVVFDRALTNELAAYGPHKGVDAVAPSPGHRWLATGSSEDRLVKVWNVATGSNVLTFPGGTSPRPLFSGDGRWLAVAGDVFDLRATTGVWPPAPPLPFLGGRPVTGAAAFSADGRWLAILCDLTTVQLFDLKTFQRLGVLRLPAPMRMNGLAFSPDGRWLVAVGTTGRFRAWDLPRMRERLAEFQLDWDLP